MTERLDLLLLGGSGFVGRALLRDLAARPAGSVRVRALLRTPDAVPSYPFLDKVAGSLEDLPAALEPEGRYVLVHFAVKHIDVDGSGYHATNVDATDRLLTRLGTRLIGILYGSSMAVYGRGAQDGVLETTPRNAETPLADSRVRAECTVEEHARRRGIPAFLLRPRFVLGEGDRFVLPALAKLQRKRLSVASGAQRFSVMDVADYARILVRLAERVRDRAPGAAAEPQALNIGYERPVSLAEIIGVLSDTLGLPAPRFRVPVSTGITNMIRRLPLGGAEQLATRLELVGLSHWGNASSLAAAVGGDLVRKDPLIAVRRAAEELAA